MNRKQITITIDAGPTDKPAGEGHEVTELGQHVEAIRAAVVSPPPPKAIVFAGKSTETETYRRHAKIQYY